VEIPETQEPLIRLDGARLLPIEDAVRANLDLLYPGRIVVGAHAFRVTRSGDVQLDETSAGNFLQSIEEELTRRTLQPVLRLQVGPGDPPPPQGFVQAGHHF